MTPEAIWTVLGGSGSPPSRLGRFSGPLLVLGGGRCAWEDFAKVDPWKGETMAVNDIGAHFHGRIRHWVTLHPEYMPGWRTYREKHLYGQGVPAMTHSNKMKDGVDVQWSVENVGGTSGLFACFIGLMLGYNEILLAGIPMDNTGHYFDAPQVRTDNEDKAVSQCWRWARDNIFAGRVQSLSGNTKAWLGCKSHAEAALIAGQDY